MANKIMSYQYGTIAGVYEHDCACSGCREYRQEHFPPAQLTGGETTGANSPTTKNQKENSMFEVAIMSTPSLVAQQSGKRETAVAELKSYVAVNDAEAILQAGAANHAAVQKAIKDGETLRVIVRKVG